MSVLRRLLLIISVATASKLNVPRVLLPFSEEGTSFTLRSTNGDGCFRWKATRPDVVTITPIDPGVDGCSSAVSVAAVASSVKQQAWIKTQTVVMAEDVSAPGLFLRCDVIVDVIKSLRIVTKTHELFLEEAPEEFAVRAYDAEGNEFSTLKNIIFKWHLEDKTGRSGGGSVRFIKFRDNPYAVESEMEAIEARGKQGHKVLLEGIKTGSAKVSVQLTSGAYKDKVPSAETWLVVVTNLFLVPHSALLMIGSEIAYHAEQMKGNKIHRITLPSPEYSLSIEDENLGTLEEERVTALAEGTTFVSLLDHNTEEEAFKSPTSELRIGVPAYITISIPPHHNWRVVKDQTYVLNVEIFDSEHQRFHSSDNLVIEMTSLDQELFEIVSSLDNGTSHVGRPLRIGLANVKASLLGVRRRGGGGLIPLEVPLTAKAQLEIFDAINLNPPVSVFPWDPVTRPSYSVVYEVPGYTSTSLIWSTSNGSVSAVSQAGVATTADEIGVTEIRAAMKQAVHNYGNASIRVLPVSGLRILRETVLETEVEKVLRVPLSIFSEELIYFTHCEKLKISSRLSDSGVFHNTLKVEAKLEDDHCAILPVKGRIPGFSKLTVTYEDGMKILKDEITIAAYRPLKPLNPELLLAMDTSLSVKWTGGPLPWIHRPESHYYRLSVVDPDLISFTHISSKANVFVYRIFCRALGSTSVTLTVGNSVSNSLLEPVSVASSITVTCGEPDRIKLEAGLPDFGMDCPLTAKMGGQVAAQNYADLDLTVTVLDGRGQKFDNISNLQIELSISDSTLASLKDKTSEDQNRINKILRPKGVTGVLEVTASMKKKSLFMTTSLKDTLNLRLVQDAEFTPTSMTVFNHPNNIRKFVINHGSGYFRFSSSEPDIVKTKYTSSNQTVSIIPLNSGDMTLIAKDLCLPMITDAKAQVHVTGIHRVELSMPDKVMLGNSVVATVKIYDDKGQSMNLNYIDLIPFVSSKIVEILPHGSSKFKVKGHELGDTNVAVEARSATSSATSASLSIQVFPPLVVEPKNITLIVGAKFQVKVSGGPSNSEIEFVSGNGKIAVTDSVGLIEATALGLTKVTAKVTDRASSIVEDHCYVTVIPLKSVKIKAPLLYLKVGSEMPLTASDLFTFASVTPPINIKWSLDNDNVAELINVFHGVGFRAVEGPNLGSVRLRAKSPGRVIVKLKVNDLSDKMEIQIFEDLRLIQPNLNFNKNLIMAVNSGYQLKTNRRNVTFESSCDGLVTISPSGFVDSGGNLGSCVVLVKVVEEFSISQYFSLVIEIKAVQYLMISSLSSIKSKTFPYLPMGLKLELHFTYHDNLGQVFDAVGFSEVFSARPSRFDSIRITSDSISVELIKDEFTVLRISDNAGFSDFVVFNVGPLNPFKDLFVGDILSLTPFLTDGYWISEPQGLINVNDLGQAQLIRSGQAKLININNSQRIISEVDIKPVRNMSFKKPDTLSNVKTRQDVGVLFDGRSSGLEDSEISSLSYFPYKCSAHWKSNDEFVAVRPEFSSESSYVCRFEKLSNDKPDSVALSVIPLTENVGGDEITISYYPGFVTSPKDTISMSNAEPSAIISASGIPEVLSDLSVEVSDSRVLEIGRQYYEDELRLKVIPLYLRTFDDDLTDPLSVTLSSGLTGQKVNLKVRVSFSSAVEGGRCAANVELSWSTLLIWMINHYQTIIFTVIIAAVCVALTKQTQARWMTTMHPPPPQPQHQSPNNLLKSPLLSSTSAASSPLLNAENRPYLWTIDNSPIYGSPNRSPPRSLTQQYLSS